MASEKVAARVLATYLIPGCVGRGVRLGSENSSGAGAAGAAGAGAGVWKSRGHFSGKKKAPAATYPQVQGFQKYGGHFFVEKKAPAATYPQVQGFQKFGPLEIQAEKQGFRTAWLITGQKFPWKNLKSGLSLLAFRDPSSHICEIILRMAKSGIWMLGKSRIYFRPQHIFPHNQFHEIFFRAMPCQYFSAPRFSVPCRAKIFRAMIFRAGPCHKSPGPPCRARASLVMLLTQSDFQIRIMKVCSMRLTTDSAKLGQRL